ncbi:lipopolysaccharide biosynthesis protein [Thalassotalea fusca]
MKTRIPEALAKKGFWLLLMKLAATMLSLAFHYVVVATLSVEEFGLFTLLLTITLFSVTFSKAGIEQTAVKYIASRKYAIKQTYDVLLRRMSRNCFWVIGVVVILMILNVFNLPSSLNITSYLVVISLIIIAQSLLGFNSSVLKGFSSAVTSNFFSGMCTFIIAMIILFTTTITSAFEALLVLVFAYIVSTTLSFLVVRFKFSKDSDNVQRELSLVGKSELSTYSYQVLVISVAALVTQQISPIIMAQSLTLTDIGIFGFAFKIAVVMGIPLQVVNTITSPMYARYAELDDYQQLVSLAKSTTKLLFLIASIGLIALWISAKYIVSFFNEGYAEAAWIVKILALGQWANLSTGSVVSILLMTGHEKLFKRNTLILTSINLLCLLVFIPIYGIYAAAIITAIFMALKNLFALYFVNKHVYSIPIKTGEIA